MLIKSAPQDLYKLDSARVEKAGPSMQIKVFSVCNVGAPGISL